MSNQTSFPSIESEDAQLARAIYLSDFEQAKKKEQANIKAAIDASNKEQDDIAAAMKASMQDPRPRTNFIATCIMAAVIGYFGWCAYAVAGVHWFLCLCTVALLALSSVCSLEESKAQSKEPMSRIQQAFADNAANRIKREKEIHQAVQRKALWRSVKGFCYTSTICIVWTVCILSVSHVVGNFSNNTAAENVTKATGYGVPLNNVAQSGLNDSILQEPALSSPLATAGMNNSNSTVAGNAASATGCDVPFASTTQHGLNKSIFYEHASCPVNNTKAKKDSAVVSMSVREMVATAVATCSTGLVVFILAVLPE